MDTANTTNNTITANNINGANTSAARELPADGNTRNTAGTNVKGSVLQNNAAIESTNVTRFGYIQSERPMLEAELSCVNGENSSGKVYIYGLDNGVYIQTDTSGMPHSENFGYSVSDGTSEILTLPELMTNSAGESSSGVYTDGSDISSLADMTVTVHDKNNDLVSGKLKRIL